MPGSSTVVTPVSRNRTGRKKGRLIVESLTERPCRPVDVWRTSTHSTAARSPACLEVASGQLINGVFVIDQPAAKSALGPQPLGDTSADSGSQDVDLFGDGTAATVKAAARRMAPAVLPDVLLIRADTFAAADLGTLRPESLRVFSDGAPAERLIVVGLVEVSEVKSAAERLGIDVVARVDRTRTGSGRRGGVPWMVFSRGGGRPTPVTELQGQFTSMSPVLKRAVPRQLSESVFNSSYTWLDQVNHDRVGGGEYTTNCVLAAIATDQTLIEQGVRGDLDYFATPPETPWPRRSLREYRGREPVEVAGYHSVVNAMLTAGFGARGMVVVSVGGTDFDHAFNVVHDEANGVVFLNGQTGRQAELPADFQSLQFLPTSDDFPMDAVDRGPEQSRRNALLGGQATSTVAPSDQATDASVVRRATTFIERGGAAERADDIVDDWQALSRLGFHQRRSAALREIDRALDEWKNGGRLTPDSLRQNERELHEILYAIDHYRQIKNERSSRAGAINRLQEDIQARLDVVRAAERAAYIDGLINDLDSSVIASDAPPADDVLGPDLFGLLEDTPPPPFLAGHDYSNLSAGRSISFLRALDLTRSVSPSRKTMAPTALLDRVDRVEEVWRPADSRFEWARGKQNIPPLSGTSSMPWILFAIWLGGPLAESGKMGEYRDTFAAANTVIRPGRSVDKLLLTDVPRSTFEAVRYYKNSRNEARDRYADILSMLKWAMGNDIKLVNVDELFNSEYRMRLRRFFRAEMNKQTPLGYAAASDILRLEFLHRFGGIYSDGDNPVEDLQEIPPIIEGRWGYAVGRHTDALVNSCIVVTKGHPFVHLYLEEIASRYDVTQIELLNDVTGDATLEDYDKKEYKFDRYSIMNRTGPGLLADLLSRLGGDYPHPPSAIGVGSANSWVPKPTALKPGPSESSVTSWDRSTTLVMVQKIVQTLVRNLLHNRPGDLHLTSISGVIAQHPRSDEIWTAVLSFIASRPDLAAAVRTVTSERYINRKIEKVELPEAAAALLNISVRSQREFAGEYMYDATMVSPTTNRSVGSGHLRHGSPRTRG